MSDKARLLSGSEMSAEEHEEFKHSYACKFLMEFLHETAKAVAGSVQFKIENGMDISRSVEDMALVRAELIDLMNVVNNFELLQQRINENKQIIESNGVKR